MKTFTYPTKYTLSWEVIISTNIFIELRTRTNLKSNFPFYYSGCGWYTKQARQRPTKYYKSRLANHILDIHALKLAKVALPHETLLSIDPLELSLYQSM